MATDSSSDRDPVERLAEEYLWRRRRGESATIEDYAERYPMWADSIRAVFPALEMMERLKPTSGDRTGSFDGGSGGDGVHPDRLGDYRIIREIGRGGMGIVYEAFQESLGRHVALKVLPAAGRVDPVQMERFRLEARSAAKLHHTHIVPVHGVGRHDGVNYYAMQFIQGCGLDAVLDDLRRLRAGTALASRPGAGGISDPEAAKSLAAAHSLLGGGTTAHGATVVPGPAGLGLPADDGPQLSGHSGPDYHRAVARIGVQVAEALAHAHGQGVLHRDIKPSNLLLDAEGKAWITDFGLAKIEGSDGPTRTGDVVGTLRYMAPERFDGWSDPRSDVYGLGMTLYEMLTLQPAFAGVSRARLIERVMHAAPSPPRKIDPKIPRDLETIVLKAISRAPAERYPTALALAEDLKNYLVGKPILARRVGPIERAWQWCRRNPSAAALIGVTGLAAMTLAGLGVMLVFQSKLRDAYAVAESALGREREFLYTNRIIFAHRELTDHNPTRADQLLDECPSDRRGWEWDYLKRQCHGETMKLVGHESNTYNVVFTPDGRRLVSAGGASVRVWDVESGTVLDTWDRPNAAIEGLSVSRDGSRVAIASSGIGRLEPLEVRELKTGRVVFSTDLRLGTHSGVAFSDDGSLLAAAPGQSPPADPYVYLLDARTGKEIKRFSTFGEPSGSVSFSPDGRSLLAAVGKSTSYDSAESVGRVVVWDVESGRVRHDLREHRAPVMFACYSPDGKMIGSCGYDATVRLWDAGTGKLVRELTGHRNCVNRIAFSPDGRRLASSSDDNSGIVWDVSNGRRLSTLSGHRGGIFGVAFHPDGKRLATGGYEGQVKIWDATRAVECQVLTTPRPPVPATALAFSPEGSILASASSDHTIKLWDMPGGRLKSILAGHSEAVWGIAFSRDRRWMASVAGDWRRPDQEGEVFLWDAKTYELVRQWNAHRGTAWTAAFSPNGLLLATGGGETHAADSQIILWDVGSGRAVRSIPCPGGGVRCVAFHPDGHAVAGTTGKRAHAWDVSTGRILTTFSGHQDAVSAVDYNTDGTRVATAGSDLTIRVWDASTGSEIWRTNSHGYVTNAVTFSPDGLRIASVGGDTKLKLRDAVNGQELLSLDAYDSYVLGVAFSPDGYRIATCDHQGIIKIWDGSPWAEPLSPRATTPKAEMLP